ncbi:MAG TPA: hypothetical protein VFP14_13035, partial [Novosphingobium sp.]|nr:hypothetical protein [Novosphingobium sp.]
MSLALVLVCLAIRAIVPAGYMINAQSLVLTVEVCADTTGEHLFRQITIPQSDAPGGLKRGEHPPACPFSSLSALGLAAAVPAVLVAALAFALALG